MKKSKVVFFIHSNKLCVLPTLRSYNSGLLGTAVILFSLFLLIELIGKHFLQQNMDDWHSLYFISAGCHEPQGRSPFSLPSVIHRGSLVYNRASHCLRYQVGSGIYQIAHMFRYDAHNPIQQHIAIMISQSGLSIAWFSISIAWGGCIIDGICQSSFSRWPRYLHV